MRPQKKLTAPEPVGQARYRKGHKPVLVRLTEAQLAVLHKEAARRAMEAGSIRPDMSAIVREALDAWITKNAPKR